ncbi:MAG: hypothetical protein ABI772_04790 [Bacteroidota bacterium]
MKPLLLIAGIMLLTGNAYGQASVRDSAISMVMVEPGFAFQFPYGDMADRFGANSSASMDVFYKRKNGWMVGIQGTFLFGSKVKQENLFSNLINSQGQVIATDGKYSDIRAFERGYTIILSAGRLFNFKKPNPNTGIAVTMGAGYMQHKIRIEDKLNLTPSLQGEYVKGYDHLASGLCLRQSASYIYVGNRRLVNFFITAEVIEGFTKGRRSFDFDLEIPDTGNRIDILAGLRLGWILPLYKAAPEKYYYY